MPRTTAMVLCRVTSGYMNSLDWSHWTGALDWSTGLEYWSTGTLEHWSTGALEPNLGATKNKTNKNLFVCLFV